MTAGVIVLIAGFLGMAVFLIAALILAARG